jgi:predicted AAA+ superfamily ATPase
MKKHGFKRYMYTVLRARIEEPRRFIQVLWGPRQTGKTTLARQVMESVSIPSVYASSDEPALKGHDWIEQQWNAARHKAKSGKAVLILDEIQKIPGWSETVKKLWDEDTRENVSLQLVVLGSSPLLVQGGLAESLAGRFEIIPVTHWSYSEMKEAFGWDLEQYIFFGGYPGAVDLITDYQRWAHYIKDSLIETTISRDILLMKRVDKPALLRRLFDLGCTYSGQVLSYQKMLGQLHDAGNTTTLAHYLDLLDGTGLLTGLAKYSGRKIRQRASSPKILILNTALMTSMSQKTMDEAKRDTEYWGKLVESAVGGSLANGIKGTGARLFYWSGKNQELDYVLQKEETLVAIEVKSGAKKVVSRGIEAFAREYPVKKKLLVGAQGIPLEEFFQASPLEWFE